MVPFAPRNVINMPIKILPFQFYFVLTAALTGAIFIRRFSLVEKLIWIILVLNVLIDAYARYIGSQGIHNGICYNVLVPLEILIMIYIYNITSKNHAYKILTYGLSGVLLVFAVVVAMFLQERDKLHTYTIAFGGIMVGALSYLRLRKIIINDINLTDNILFWFCAANFIYYIIFIPVLSVLPIANDISNELARSIKKVNNYAYALWSTLITIGFICSRKNAI